MSKDRQINRRHFFRHGLGELLRPLAQLAQPIEEAIRQIGSIDADLAAAHAHKPAQPQTPARLNLLRPPGALPEEQFRQTCSRCQECVRVCPVECIKIDTTGAIGAGVPYIDVDAKACVLCTGLHCMHNCPSGALLPIPITDIDMGTAIWHQSSCLRTKADSGGENCTICVDQCPIGEMAIGVNGNRIEVIESGCTGCGMCQHHCPTTPKSITVKPRSTDQIGIASPRSTPTRPGSAKP